MSSVQSALSLFVGTISVTLLAIWQLNRFKVRLENMEQAEKQSLAFKKLQQRLLDNISQVDLESMIKSSDIELRSIAINLLFDQAMHTPCLDHILDSIDSPDEQTRQNGFVAIQLLAQQDSNRDILIRRGVLEQVVQALLVPSSDVTYRHGVFALYQLVLNSDKNKLNLCSYEVVDLLLGFLLANPERSSDLKYWCIMLFHQFSQIDSLIEMLIEKRLVFVLLDQLKLYYSNITVLKLCLHASVRIIASMEDDSVSTLEEIVNLNLLPVITGCLRSNDAELVSWTIFLLHDFIARKVYMDKIYNTPGFVKSMLPFIRPDETIIPRIILKMLKLICDYNKLYYKTLMDQNILKPLMSCMNVSDERVQYWALALLSVLLYQLRNHSEFFKQNGVKALMNCSKNASSQSKLLIIEILGNLCSDPLNIPSLEKDVQLAILVQKFSNGPEIDLRSSALSVMINFISLSEKFKKALLDNNCFKILKGFFLDANASQTLRPNVCKALVTFAKDDSEMILLLLARVIVPGFQSLFETITNTLALFSSSDIKQSAEVYSTTSTHSPATFTPIKFTWESSPSPGANSPHPLTKQVSAWRYSLIGLRILLTGMDLTSDTEEAQRLKYYLEDYFEDISASVVNSILFASVEHPHLDTTLAPNVAAAGLQLLITLISVSEFREQLYLHDIMGILMDNIWGKTEKIGHLCFQSIECILRNEYPIEFVLKKPEMFLKQINLLNTIRDEDLWPVFSQIAASLADFSETKETPLYICLDEKRSTKEVQIYNNSLDIRNYYSWAFQTVYGTHGVSKSGKYAYEMQLGSSGIIQIGWASQYATINDYAGLGIGGTSYLLDDKESFAFDGYRVRKWNSRDVDQDFYGSRWTISDIVTCLIDLDNCTISYQLNGTDLGIAFSGFDNTKIYYPAASLIERQFMQFRFGSELDRLIYCPEGYLALDSILSRREERLTRSISPEVVLADWQPLNDNLFTDVSFYYEIKLGLRGKLPGTCVLVGIMTAANELVFVAYDVTTELLSLFKAVESIKNADYFDRQVPETMQREGHGKIATYHKQISEASILGVGISNKHVFFSLNGSLFGPQIAIEDCIGLPFVRNLPRYIFNFGRSDFVTTSMNTAFSPSTFPTL